MPELTAADIDFISAHGNKATVYNDEMESKATNLCWYMQDVPVNSLKGYYGHTLGAGLIKAIHSLRENVVLPTVACELGCPCRWMYATACRKNNFEIVFLKTASGIRRLQCNPVVVKMKNKGELAWIAKEL